MFYLNVKNPIDKYINIVRNPLYVDKSLLINRLYSYLDNGLGHDICITRPRRFGKTINANMLAAYYTKGYDTKSTFDQLKISQCNDYLTHLNQYNVIYIDFSRMDDECSSYTDYITPIKEGLKTDLISQYHIEPESYEQVYDWFYSTNDRFIFILDELWEASHNSSIIKKSVLTLLKLMQPILGNRSLRLTQDVFIMNYEINLIKLFTLLDGENIKYLLDQKKQTKDSK
ncbi:MAG: AAA family ATPase [Erysipelotrichaceae bacterium]|nr:AAA family ATPase [Erysipelotrichaceae bacterium]